MTGPILGEPRNAVTAGDATEQRPHPKISLIVPTLNGGPVWSQTLQAVLHQHSREPFELIVVDSSSSDGTPETTLRLATDASANPRNVPVTTRTIAKSDFDHGGTRNLAAGLARGAILVFLSQDATPASHDWLDTLVQPFADSRVAGSFCRQAPRPTATFPEQFNMTSTYPRRSHVLSLDSDNLMRQRTLFSDAASAMRKSVWEDFPFDENLLMYEDQRWAVRVLQAGFSIAYVGTTHVLHSHHYTLGRVFRHYFDVGVDLPRNINTGTRDSYASFLAHEVAAAVSAHRVTDLPYTALYEFARCCGYALGRSHGHLPRWLCRRLSNYPSRISEA